MTYFSRVLSVCLLVASSTAAQANAQFERLFDLLKIDDYVAITREEGLRHNADIVLDLLGAGALSALDQIDRVHDPVRLEAVIYDSMKSSLSETDVSDILAFFDTDAGDAILSLELAARQAMSDPTIEDAARSAWLEAQADDNERKLALKDLTQTFDLVERNTAGALNAQLLFYKGINASQSEMTEDEMLAEVWSQEEAIRNDTIGWLGGYMWLAYNPLSDAELDAYLRFAKSREGQVLNAALFDGFNTMYDELSYAIGRVIGLNMQSTDL